MKSWFSIKKSRLRPCIVGPVGSLGQIITSAIGLCRSELLLFCGLDWSLLILWAWLLIIILVCGLDSVSGENGKIS